MNKFRSYLTRASSEMLEDYFALNICAANIVAFFVRINVMTKASETYESVQMLKSRDLSVTLCTFSHFAIIL